MPASVPCIFSDQQGRGRTSLGMVIACLIKEMQITTELRSDQQTAFIMPVANNFGKVLGLRTKVFEITKALTMNVEEPRIPFKQLSFAGKWSR